METTPRAAFLFDLDGTLIDSVYQHVLAWREALEQGGIRLSVWRIHRRIGMSGGLFVNALLRETGREIAGDEAERLRQFHAAAYGKLVSQVRRYPAPKNCWTTCPAPESPTLSPPAGGRRLPTRR